MVLPIKNFIKIKASRFNPPPPPPPPKEFHIFYSTPKEILNFSNLSQKNSISGQ